MWREVLLLGLVEAPGDGFSVAGVPLDRWGDVLTLLRGAWREEVPPSSEMR